jgi:hypothetical protein
VHNLLKFANIILAYQKFEFKNFINGLKKVRILIVNNLTALTEGESEFEPSGKK